MKMEMKRIGEKELWKAGNREWTNWRQTWKEETGHKRKWRSGKHGKTDKYENVYLTLYHHKTTQDKDYASCFRFVFLYNSCHVTSSSE